MNVEKFLVDYRIPYSTEHKNVRDGWIGFDCPFCGTFEKYHMGYSLDEQYFSCWTCGGHSPKNVVARLLRINTDHAQEIVEQYGGKKKHRAKVKIKSGTSRFKLPPGNLELQPYHKAYLERRNFDWENLKEVWGIMGTGPMAKLDGTNYARRIVAPIFWDQQIVSFQARDITDRHSAKYMACPPEREKILHKHILYGRQDLWTRRGICVEGITDVWRLGPNAFCTFGIKYTTEQVREIVKHFDEVIVLYDPEELAQEQADKLVARLKWKGLKATKEVMTCDPGEMSDGEAENFVKNTMGLDI